MDVLRFGAFLVEEAGASGFTPLLLLQNHRVTSYMRPPSWVLTQEPWGSLPALIASGTRTIQYPNVLMQEGTPGQWESAGMGEPGRPGCWRGHGFTGKNCHSHSSLCARGPFSDVSSSGERWGSGKN